MTVVGVVDIFLALIFARALLISVSRRFLVGIAAVVGATALWLALAVSGWLGRGADDLRMTGALFLMLLGPSVTPAPTPRVPWSAAFAACPIAGKLVIAVVLLVPFTVAWRRAQALSPLSDAASALKKLALVYLAPALLLIAQAVCFEMAAMAPDWI